MAILGIARGEMVWNPGDRVSIHPQVVWPNQAIRECSTCPLGVSKHPLREAR